MDDNELRALAHRVRDRVEGGVDLDTALDRAISGSKRDRGRTWSRVGIAGVAAGLVVVVAAVSLVTRGGGDDVLRSSEPAPVEVSTPDADVSTATSVLDETSPTLDVPASTSVPVAADTECQGVPPAGGFDSGGFGTVPSALDASSLTVSITAEAQGGCPLDELDVVIDVTNTGTDVVAFASELGVLLSAGSAKWSVGAPEEMKLAPGESRSQTVSILIPNSVAPGTYTLLVAGYEASAPFVVYESAATVDAVDTSPRGLFETVAPADGVPAVLGEIPDGYRPVYANTDVRPAASTLPSWSATLVQNPGDDERIKPYLIVQIEDLADADPYLGFPGLADTAEVTFGAFTGRITYLAPGHPTFVVLLDDSRRLMIGGRTSEVDLVALADGLTVETASVVGQIATVPDGYEIVDGGPMNGRGEMTRWDVGYAREQLMASLITVRATLNPETTAANQLLMPTPSDVVDINGYTGYLGSGRVVFDVSPNYQIELTREDDFTESPIISDEELLRLARTIVPISNDEFSDIRAAAANNPLTPTDNPCSFYIRASDPVATPQVTQRADGLWTTTTPGAFTIDITTTQPLGTVTVGVTSLGSSDLIPLAMLEDLDDTATVEVAWDGTDNGQPAPPGDYYVFIQAAPIEINDQSCTADTAAHQSLASTNTAFQVI